MRRKPIVACFVIAMLALLVPALAAPVGASLAGQPAPPTPAPSSAPAEDRVGFPEGYERSYQTFFVMDRPDNKQVRANYANDAAASVSPVQRSRTARYS
jgi:hypothetical protein